MTELAVAADDWPVAVDAGAAETAVVFAADDSIVTAAAAELVLQSSELKPASASELYL